MTDHLHICNWLLGSSDADVQTIPAGAQSLMHSLALVCQTLCDLFIQALSELICIKSLEVLATYYICHYYYYY